MSDRGSHGDEADAKDVPQQWTYPTVHPTVHSESDGNYNNPTASSTTIRNYYNPTASSTTILTSHFHCYYYKQAHNIKTHSNTMQHCNILQENIWHCMSLHRKPMLWTYAARCGKLCHMIQKSAPFGTQMLLACSTCSIMLLPDSAVDPV